MDPCRSRKKKDDESCTNGNKNDPNTILPTDDLVNGAKALLKLTRIVSPESKLDRLGYDSFSYDDYEDTIDNGIYQLEQLTSRVLSLLLQTHLQAILGDIFLSQDEDRSTTRKEHTGLSIDHGCGRCHV